MVSKILDGFKVPANGLGKRRWKLYVIDELLARRGDQDGPVTHARK